MRKSSPIKTFLTASIASSNGEPDNNASSDVDRRTTFYVGVIVRRNDPNNYEHFCCKFSRGLGSPDNYAKSC